MEMVQGLAKVTKRLVVTITASLIACCIAFTGPSEGRVHKAYPDGGGVWTICDGYSWGVKEGDTATDAECDEKQREAHEWAANAVLRLTVPIPHETFVAVEDFVYNLGATAYAGSTLRRKINAGDIRGGCQSIIWIDPASGRYKGWVFVKKKDCNDRASNCRGIIVRRLKMRAQCLKGAQ